MSISKQWKIDVDSIDFKKARTACEGIRHTFTLKPGVDMHPGRWEHIIYAVLQYGLFEKLDVKFGDDDRPYVHIYVPLGEEIDLAAKERHVPQNKIVQAKQTDTHTFETFKTICAYALESYSGVKFFTSRDPSEEPKFSIRMGALWAFYRFNDVGGCKEVVDCMTRAIPLNNDCPDDAIINRDDLSSKTSKLTNNFLDDFLQLCIQQELRKHLKNPSIEVKFSLYEQNIFALRYMVLIETHPNFSNHEKMNAIMQRLRWYMPLYLPIAVKVNGKVVSYR